MRYLLIPVLALLLVGCATTDVLTGEPLQSMIPPGATIAPGSEPPSMDVLTQLANNGLIAAVLDDASATEAWVNAQNPPLEPMKRTLALACPTAARAAATDFHDRVLQYKALLDQAKGDASDSFVGKPRLMLHLTQLKYGANLDPQALIAQAKADINLRLDALWTGCSHLFPKKQAIDFVDVATKAGFKVGMLGL